MGDCASQRVNEIGHDSEGERASGKGGELDDE